MDKFCFDPYGNLLYTIVDPEDTRNLEAALDEAGFIPKEKNDNSKWILKGRNIQFVVKTIKDIVEYCELSKISLDRCEEVDKYLNEKMPDKFEDAIPAGLDAKTNCPICKKRFDEHDDDEIEAHLKQFKPDTSPTFIRKLLNHQKISVNHLLAISNGANFSVPGSGKTTISYAVISKWIQDKIIDKIIVIGPISAFSPWEEEYKFCFGIPADSKRIGGSKDIEEMKNSEKQLFLMGFTTASKNMMALIDFMDEHNVLLIVDESHNIKNHKLKLWSRSAITLASSARRRMILTGTPMPNDARDLWTQLTFLWPNNYPLGHLAPYIRYALPHGIGDKYKDAVNPLFTRITKEDLGLPDVNIEPIRVPLMPIQQKIYDVIKVKTLENINSLREQGKLQKFRRAKMIRLIQAASNPSSIFEKADEFELDGIDFGYPEEKISLAALKEDIDDDLYSKIINYSQTGEIPSKLTKAAKMAEDLIKKNEKVIIWCWSIANINVLENQLLKHLNPIVIHGKISKDPKNIKNRDKLIKNFKKDKKARVLIASISALSEAISLHIDIDTVDGKEIVRKVCSNAIYLERNFNGAQFMQSMDRIHRVGMDHKLTVNYYCLIAKNTIDEQIHDTLGEKIKKMGKALDDSWIEQLDYDGNEKEINEKELGVDFQSLVKHLRGINDSNNR